MMRLLSPTAIVFSCLTLAAQGKEGAKSVKPANPAATPAKPDAAESKGAARSEAEDLLLQKATPYRPNSTKDPFYALTDNDAGKKGDLVDEIGVKGKIISNGKPMAVVSDSTGNIRWLPVGYKFKDGVIAAIDDKSVTFHQWEVNTTNTTNYRTVVKTFKREEGKR